MFDHLHPEDVEKVREQLSTQEPQNSGRILDLKTGTVKKEGHQCKSSILIIYTLICSSCTMKLFKLVKLYIVLI